MKVHPYRRQAPLRKFIRALNDEDMQTFLADNTKRGWKPVDEVKVINGFYEVLVELDNGFHGVSEQQTQIAKEE